MRFLSDWRGTKDAGKVTCKKCAKFFKADTKKIADQ